MKINFPRAAILFCLLGALVGFLANIYIATQSAREFRKQPDWRTFTEEMQRPNWKSPVFRYVIFYSGSDDYNETITSWLEKTAVKPAIFDSFWIKRLLKNASAYQITNLLPALGERLDIVRGLLVNYLDDQNSKCDAIPLLADKASFILRMRLETEVAACLKSLMNIDTNYLPEYQLVPQDELLFRILVDDATRRQKIHLVAAVLNQQPNPNPAYLEIFKDQMLNATPHEWQIVMDTNSSELAAAACARALSETESPVFLDCFHRLLDMDSSAADEFASTYLIRSDTTFRKAVIVLLARHDTTVGLQYIDEAFTGAARREEQFTSIHQYSSSKAARLYILLARHDYLQTGKEFPAIYCLPPHANEVAEWTDFINYYPWFPGTDDAYLRLASRLVLDGRSEEALEVLKSMENAVFADSDAKELLDDAYRYIDQVKRGIVTAPSPTEHYRTNTCEG